MKNLNKNEDQDPKIINPNEALETKKEHKDWYNRDSGKMRSKPKMVNKELKKAKGTRKHSLRKEK